MSKTASVVQNRTRQSGTWRGVASPAAGTVVVFREPEGAATYYELGTDDPASTKIKDILRHSKAKVWRESPDPAGVRAPEPAPPEAAIQEARARGRALAASLLAAPDMLTADAMAERLGVSRMTVNTWRRKGRLLGLAGAKRGYRFPGWQLDDEAKPLSGLEGLADRLGSPWAVYRFLLRGHAELEGLSGLEALRRGAVADALAVAETTMRDFS